jgi:hypothetical protein
MRTKQGRNEPCACGSGQKYKRCCGVAKAEPLIDFRADELHDRRYLIDLSWPEFADEFATRLGAFVGERTAALPPMEDTVAAADRYRGAIRLVPMIHRPTEGWRRVPKDVVSLVRASQQELIGCLQDLAAEEEIVIVAEGFEGQVDTAAISAAAAKDASLRRATDGYGVGEFIIRNPHVPVVGGDIPAEFLAMHVQIAELYLVRPDVRPLYNVLQEFRNRNAVRIATRAARELKRTPVIVFGFDHAEGIAQAARKIPCSVNVKILASLAGEAEHFFDEASPLRRH